MSPDGSQIRSLRRRPSESIDSLPSKSSRNYPSSVVSYHNIPTSGLQTPTHVPTNREIAEATPNLSAGTTNAVGMLVDREDAEDYPQRELVQKTLMDFLEADPDDPSVWQCQFCEHPDGSDVYNFGLRKVCYKWSRLAPIWPGELDRAIQQGDDNLLVITPGS